MFTPLFERDDFRCILLDKRYYFPTEQEALGYGLIAQLFVSNHDFLFKGESKYVTNQTEFVLMKDTSPITGETIELGIISGKVFDQINSGLKYEQALTLPEIMLRDNVFILDIIPMNEESNMTIATALEKDTFEPYVIIVNGDKTDAVSPDVAYEISARIAHAASAAWNDSYLRRALEETFADDELSQSKKEQLLENIRQLREERRELEYAERQATQEEEQSEEVLP